MSAWKQSGYSPVHRGDDTCSDGFAFVHQRFEPRAESLAVKAIVAAGRRAPQVEIKDGRHLRGRCCSDECSAGVEPAISNQVMKDLGSQAGHHLREVWRVEHARKPIVDAGGVIRPRIQRRWNGLSERLSTASFATRRFDAFRHEPPMIRGAAANKQS
jgi:hypothetical protein